MHVTREFSLTMLVCAASAWALMMVVGGAWLVLHRDSPWPLPPGAAVVAGVFCIAAGEFLFMCLVADRWFPRALREITWVLEGAAGLALIVSFLLGVFLVARAMLAPA